MIPDAQRLMHSMAARARTLIDARQDLLLLTAIEAGIDPTDLSRGELLEAVLIHQYTRHAKLIDGAE